MELTKSALSQVTFTCKRHKFYLASEVDEFLDEMADAADEMQKELAGLRVKAAEYDKQTRSIATALVAANQSAMEILDKASSERQAMLEKAQTEKRDLEGANNEMFRRTMQLKKLLNSYVGEMEHWVNRVLAIHNGTPQPVPPDDSSVNGNAQAYEPVEGADAGEGDTSDGGTAAL